MDWYNFFVLYVLYRSATVYSGVRSDDDDGIVSQKKREKKETFFIKDLIPFSFLNIKIIKIMTLQDNMKKMFFINIFHFSPLSFSL